MKGRRDRGRIASRIRALDSTLEGSGDIVVENVSGDLEIEDGSGSIDIADVERDVELRRTGSGGVRVNGVRGRVIR